MIHPRHLIALACLVATTADASTRVALLVDNGRSTATAEKNLAALGFRTTTAKDLDQKALESELRRFLRTSPTDSTAVVVFAGHAHASFSGREQEPVVSLIGTGEHKDSRDASRADIDLSGRFWEAFTKDAGAAELHLVLDTKPLPARYKELKAPNQAHLDKLAAPQGVTFHLDPATALATVAKTLTKPPFPADFSELPPRNPVPGQRWVNGIGMLLTWCPPGRFTMGQDGQKDAAPVDVQLSHGFWIGTHELTQREYRAIRGKDPNAGRVLTHRNAPAVNFGNGSPDLAKKLTENENKAGRLPEGWTYRVPTEAQWEYACRAGTRTRFSFGDSPKDLHRYANFADASLHGEDPVYHYASTAGDDGVGATISPVARYRPNPWGLHDMHGNVSEWCREYYFRPLPGGTDPAPEEKVNNGEKVVRGGAWCSTAEYCQSGFRNSSAISNNAEKLAFLGVRLVLVPPSKQ